MRVKLLLLIILSGTSGFSQDNQKFFFGVNVGTKIANKNYATRYDGRYNNELEQMLINNTNAYYQIYTLLGNKDFYLPYDFYPQRIKYSPGIVTGVLAGYQLSPNLQASIDANFISLTIKNKFSVVVIDPANQTSQNQYELGDLYGKESRFNGKFNFDYVSDGEKAKYIIGLSGIFSAWRMDQHVATFPSGNGYALQLYSRHNPLNNITSKVSGMGWGVGVNLGIEYRLSPKFVGQLIYQPQSVYLDFGYDPMKIIRLQHDIILRILWK